MERLGVFLGVFLHPLDGMLVHCRVTPSIKFTSTHLYTWVERGTVRVKCFAQGHNTMSPVPGLKSGLLYLELSTTSHGTAAPPSPSGTALLHMCYQELLV